MADKNKVRAEETPRQDLGRSREQCECSKHLSRICIVRLFTCSIPWKLYYCLPPAFTLSYDRILRIQRLALKVPALPDGVGEWTECILDISMVVDFNLLIHTSPSVLPILLSLSMISSPPPSSYSQSGILNQLCTVWRQSLEEWAL